MRLKKATERVSQSTLATTSGTRRGRAAASAFASAGLSPSRRSPLAAVEKALDRGALYFQAKCRCVLLSR
jgi:hypothetical protein